MEKAMKKTVLNKILLTLSIFAIAVLTGCAESSDSDKKNSSVNTRSTKRIVNTEGLNNSASTNCGLNSVQSYYYHLTPGQSASQFNFNDFINTFEINEAITFNNYLTGVSNLNRSGMKFHYCQNTDTLDFIFVDDVALSTGSYSNVLKPGSGFKSLGANYNNYGLNVTAFGDDFGVLLMVTGTSLDFGDMYYEPAGQSAYFIGSFSRNL